MSPISARASAVIPTAGESGVEKLETMVVTGSAVVEPLADAPVRTEVIEREWLTRAALRDFASAIDYAPGLRVETACGVCNTQQIQMLGLPQSYIAILQDGLPTFGGLAGVYGIEQIPTGLLDRIEIVKGGGSALYGPGAVAGVINLIPRDPTQNGGSIDLRVARMEGEQVDTRMPYDLTGYYDWVIEDANLAVTAFFNGSYVRPVDVNEDGFTDVSSRDFHSAGLRAVWTPARDTRLSMDFLHTGEERRGGETGSAFSGPPNLALIGEEIESRRQLLTTKYQRTISPEWELQLSHAFARNRRDSYYGGAVALGSPDPASPFFDPAWDPQLGFGDTSNDLNFFDSQLHWTPNDEHRVTMGAQYRHETLQDRQRAAGRMVDERYELLGLMAQHRWEVNSGVTAEWGARVDLHSELEDPVISPRASVLVKANDRFRVRNSLGWGFRAPEIFDEDLHISNVGGDLRAIRLDPNLTEESAITLSVAPEWNITERWRLETNVFHTQLDDTFVLEPQLAGGSPGVLELLKRNGGRSQVQGVELNLGYIADDWRLEFAWTEQRMEYDSQQLLLGDPGLADPADNPVFSDRFPRTPNHLGMIRYVHEWPWFETFIGTRMTGPMDIPHVVTDSNGDLVGNRLQESPWFFNVDVGISKTIDLAGGDRLTLSLGIRNLLNEFQQDLERGPFRDALYVYGPAFPRTVHAGIRWEF